jgi:hypothetical protein
MPKNRWIIKVSFKDKRYETFENVVNYGFPANGSLFFVELEPKLTDGTPGSAEGRALWIPVSEIADIHSESTIIFSTLKERKEFHDQWKL